MMSILQRNKLGQIISSDGRKGHTHSAETRKKMGETRKGRTSPMKGKKHKESTKELMSKVRSGEKHYNWKGGISRGYKTGYYSKEYKKWRVAVFERDNFVCQKCFGKRGQYITAHHIKSFKHYPKLRFELNNGITLCEKCHSETDNYKGRGCNKLNKN